MPYLAREDGVCHRFCLCSKGVQTKRVVGVVLCSGALRHALREGVANKCRLPAFRIQAFGELPVAIEIRRRLIWQSFSTESPSLFGKVDTAFNPDEFLRNVAVDNVVFGYHKRELKALLQRPAGLNKWTVPGAMPKKKAMSRLPTGLPLCGQVWPVFFSSSFIHLEIRRGQKTKNLHPAKPVNG